MPLEGTCATSASSWSFTDSLAFAVKTRVKRSLFPFFGGCLTQSGYAFVKFLSHRRRREPTYPASCHLEVTRQLRSSQLWRIRSKRGDGHQSHGNDDHTPDEPKRPTQKPVYPTQSNRVDCIADDAGNNSCQHSDHEKNCQKPRQVRNRGRLHVRQKPGSNMLITPCRQDKANYGPGQRKNFKEKTMSCGEPNGKQHHAQNGPVQPVHAALKLSLNRQISSRQNLICLYVLLTGFVGNFIRQRRRRRLFVPPDRFQIVANKLLVERFLRAAWLIFVSRPEARRIRSQDLVGKNQALVCVSKFKFSVGNDNATAGCIICCRSVNFQAQIAKRFRKLRARTLAHLSKRNVFVVTAKCFGSRSKNWLWQLV